MSVINDVQSDLDHAYARWERSDVETVVQMMAQAPAGHAGGSVAAALKPVFPEVQARFESASDAEQTNYLRVLKGACVVLLELWTDEGSKPDLERVHSLVSDLEVED